MFRALVTLVACGVAVISTASCYGQEYYGPPNRGYDYNPPPPRYYRQYPRAYYYRERPGYYGGDVYDRGHPYGYNFDYGDPRCGRPNYTIQDGFCKPYTGR